MFPKLKAFASSFWAAWKKMTWRDYLNMVLDQWFLVFLGIAILIAYLVPNLGRKGGWIAAQYSVVYVCPALIFFISGLTMNSKVFLKSATLYRVHLVAQILSYMFTSCILFVFAYAALMSDDPHLSTAVIAGFILLGCTPTTIGSNVVFTRNAHGNHAATLVEVTIANLLSPVLSPALISMYMSSTDKWGDFRPAGKSSGGYNTLYRSVFKQLGLTVFVPLFVGQVLRFFFEKQVTWVALKFKINKFSQVFLILIMWSTFSSCFYTGAFDESSSQTTALVLMQNFGVYWFFLFVTLLITRGSHKLRFKNKYLDAFVGFFRFNKRDTIAICYVVPAKTPALGVPLINALYSHSSINDQAKQMLQIPIILYQIEQLCFSSLSVPVFRRWVADEEEEARLEEESKKNALMAEKANEIQASESSNNPSSEVMRSSQDAGEIDVAVGEPELAHMKVEDVEKGSYHHT